MTKSVLHKWTNKTIVFMMFVFILLSPPFYFYQMYFPSRSIPGIIRLVILFFLISHLLIGNGKMILGSNKVIPFLSFLFFYSLVSFTINYEYAIHLAHVSMCLLFSIIVYIYIITRKDILLILQKYLKIFILWVSFSVIIAPLLFLIKPSFFKLFFFNDYYIFFNPFLGSIENHGFRPCWYFAEPSLCGFFLGISLLVFSSFEISKKKKYMSLSVIIAATMISNSMGTLLFLIPSISILFLKRLFNTKLYTLFLYIIVLVLNIIIVSIDFDSMIDESGITFKKDNSSFEDRKERILNSRSHMNSMSIVDFTIGTGVDSIGKKYGNGEANGYYKLVCEYGILFTIFYLVAICYLTKYDIALKTFFILSLLSIVIFWVPIYLMLICVNKRIYEVKYISNRV